LEHFGTRLEHFGSLLEHFGHFWNILVIFWNILVVFPQTFLVALLAAFCCRRIERLRGTFFPFPKIIAGNSSRPNSVGKIFFSLSKSTKKIYPAELCVQTRVTRLGEFGQFI
jgi:hypothetical protein